MVYQPKIEEEVHKIEKWLDSEMQGRFVES